MQDLDLAISLWMERCCALKKKKIWKRRAFSLKGRYFSKTKEKEKLRFLPPSQINSCISIHNVLFAFFLKRLCLRSSVSQGSVQMLYLSKSS